MLYKIKTRCRVSFSMCDKVSDMFRVIPALCQNTNTSVAPNGNHLLDISIRNHSIFHRVQEQMRTAGWITAHRSPVMVSQNPYKWNAFSTSGQNKYNNKPHKQTECNTILHKEWIIAEAHVHTHSTTDVGSWWTAVKNNATKRNWCKRLAVVD